MTLHEIIHRARHGLYLSPADVRLLAERVGELEVAPSFDAFSSMNRRRCEEAFGRKVDAGAIDAFILGLAEEAGEVAGKVRAFLGHSKRKTATIADIGMELGDLVAYADLLATSLGLRLSDCVTEKFAAVSERMGWHPAPPTSGQGTAGCTCSAGRPDWTPDKGPHAAWCAAAAPETIREDSQLAMAERGGGAGIAQSVDEPREASATKHQEARGGAIGVSAAVPLSPGGAAEGTAVVRTRAASSAKLGPPSDSAPCETCGGVGHFNEPTNFVPTGMQRIVCPDCAGRRPAPVSKVRSEAGGLAAADDSQSGRHSPAGIEQAPPLPPSVAAIREEPDDE